MKAINILAACTFAALALTAVIVAFVSQRWEYAIIAGMCAAVFYVSLKDIKDEQRP